MSGALAGHGANAQTSAQTNANQLAAYDLPAGPLDATLTGIARRAGRIIAVDPSLVRGRNSAPVRGNLSVEQAFAQALTGSGLEIVSSGNGNYSLRAAPPRPEAAAPRNTVLPTVTVTADTEQESPTGPVYGYVARRSATATKTDTPIVETPQSISVVGTEEIEMLKAQGLQDVLGYVAGVARNEAADRTTDQFFLRGFQATSDLGTMYRDGLRYGVTRYDGRQELYGLERVEVLKGASSVLFGAAAPGGIINTVSKRPTAQPLRELNVETGSFQRKQISGDFGGPLDNDGVWSYRLTGLKRDSNSFVDHVPDDRDYLSGALKWQPSAATSLTLLAEYQKDKTVYVYGLPAEGTVLPNINGRIPRNRFVGEPGFDRFETKRVSVGYQFEHAFDAQWKLRNSLRYTRMDNDFPYVEIWGGVSDDQRRTGMRWATLRQDNSSSIVSDTSVEYRVTQGPVKHTVLVGLDYSAPREETERYTLEASALDLFAPIYTGAIGTERIPNTFSYRNKATRLGVYMQDQLKIADKWVVLLGGRYDTVRYDDVGVFGGVRADNERNHAFTGRAGLVYLADNGLAPFASYSESFEPSTGVGRDGNRFEPSKGRQIEAGLRFQPNGTSTMLSAAVYQLERRNVLVSDPQNSDFNIQAGKARSRGLELEARTRIGRNANLIAAYAYTDARTTQASPATPEDNGKRLDSVPYNQLSVWSDYGFGDFGLPGLRIGAGVRYVDSTRGAAHGNSVTVPSFLLVDAMLSYTTGPWKLALNITNLTDKTYVASCTYGCFYGEPRKAIATATYRW
ncbi:TonB-dependent siderophore receptor [Pigmentiphaga aceris]|uniref:TonB-dependent siderophore receptor n=2 Tax=Pigmentiphaga aceris TaxID=1940612 RepID=A0A5C0B338_9BURK|nr:TonB-dependent siderophore receptor [Pigmentiphaga aceris]